MKYKLIGDNDYLFDPQGTIMRNRGIEDVNTFKSLTEKVIHDYELLKNIDKAVECLVKHIENKSNILIVVDPDVDGYTSACILYQYIKILDNDCKVEYALHEDKTHGLKNITISNHINLVITPDSGSNDFTYHKELYDKGIDVIVLDHHEIDYESEYAIVVNTQLGDYPNNNLSGAGVVYKFCKALDDHYWNDDADYFLDLVALGNIADSMSMKELETQYYVQQGLKNIENDFFNALIRKQEYSLKGKLHINSIAFYISPLINAVVRVGEMQDKIDMFRAFIGEKELVEYTPRGKKECTLVPLIDDMARRCSNIKAKQGRIAERLMTAISEEIEVKGLNDNKVLFLYDLDMESGMTGYLANKIAGEYKKPTILLTRLKEEGTFNGSGRGYDKSELKDFRTVVEKTNLFEWAKGHASAYGTALKKDNVELVNEKLNDLLQEYDFTNYYIVDFKLKAKNVNRGLILDICELDYLWGKDVDEPYILIEDLLVSESEIELIGKKEDTIKIYNNENEYIIFKTNEGIYNDIISCKKLNLIGKASVEEYKGKKTCKIKVDEFSLIN